MTENQNKILSSFRIIFVILFSIVNISIMIYVSFVNQGILFAMYCTFYVMIPGLILYNLLALPDVLTKLNNYLKLVLVFFLGIFPLFIQYFILKLTGYVSIIRFTVPILAILAAVYLMKHKRIVPNNMKIRIGEIFADGKVFVYAIFSIILMLVAIYTFLQNPAKEYMRYPDTIWHMGNINMLASNSFGDFRVLGAAFSYHYFSDLFLAICNIIFGTNAFDCVVAYPVFYVPILMVLSVYGFFKHTLEKYGEKAVRAAAFILLFLPCVDSVFCNTFTFHLLTNVNAVSLALPCLLVLLSLIKLVLESGEGTDKRKYVKLLVLIFMMQILLSGFKGPIAVMVVGTAALYFILSLRYKERQIKNLILLSVTASSFAIVYLLLLSKGSGSGLIIIDFDHLFDVVPYSPLFQYYYDPIVSITSSTLLAKLILLIPNYVMAAGISGYVSIFAIFLFVCRYIKGERILENDLFSYVFMIVGLGGYYIVAHVGYSQMYFLFAALSVIVYVSVKFLTEHWPAEGTKLGSANFIKFSPAIIGILVILVSIAGNLSEHVENIIYAKDDVHYAVAGARFYEDAYSASKDEIEGLEWIKSNTDESAICATNKHYTSPVETDKNALWYYDSAYSARQYYLEGYFGTLNSGYDISACGDRVKENDKLFASEYRDEDKYELAKNLGIEYLVIHKNEEKNCVPGSSLFTKCYENEDIIIVQVG